MVEINMVEKADILNAGTSNSTAATAADQVSKRMSKPDRSKKSPLVFRVVGAGLRAIALLSPAIAGRIACELWFRPQSSYPLSPGDEALLNKLKPITVECGDHRLKAYEGGNGPLVIFQHGWGGRAVDARALVEPLINAGFKIVIFDSIAHGKSTGKRATLPEWSEALSAVADHYDETPHAVIAHSLGAMCAIHALANGLSATAQSVSVPPRIWRV